MVETPDDMCPSDDSDINIDLSHNVPSETFRDELFSEGYDSDVMMTQHNNALKELHECDNYNNARVGKDGADNVVALVVVTEQEFALIRDEDIAKLKVDSLRAELKKRGLGRKAEFKTRLKQAMMNEFPMQNAPESETANTNVFAEGAC